MKLLIMNEFKKLRINYLMIHRKLIHPHIKSLILHKKKVLSHNLHHLIKKTILS